MYIFPPRFQYVPGYHPTLLARSYVKSMYTLYIYIHIIVCIYIYYTYISFYKVPESYHLIWKPHEYDFLITTVNHQIHQTRAVLQLLIIRNHIQNPQVFLVRSSFSPSFPIFRLFSNLFPQRFQYMSVCSLSFSPCFPRLLHGF